MGGSNVLLSILKDVIILLLAPLIAVLTLILFIWQERKKLELKRQEEINQIAKSIYRDLLYLREQWQLLGFETRVEKDNVKDRRKDKTIKENF